MRLGCDAKVIKTFRCRNFYHNSPRMLCLWWCIFCVFAKTSNSFLFWPVLFHVIRSSLSFEFLPSRPVIVRAGVCVGSRTKVHRWIKDSTNFRCDRLRLQQQKYLKLRSVLTQLGTFFSVFSTVWAFSKFPLFSRFFLNIFSTLFKFSTIFYKNFNGF